jgi:hypothetical protein
MGCLSNARDKLPVVPVEISKLLRGMIETCPIEGNRQARTTFGAAPLDNLAKAASLSPIASSPSSDG